MKLLIAFLLVSGCVTRQQIEADVYQNDGIPASVCAKYPEIRNYGMYRVVACTSKPQSKQCQHGEKAFEELRPYCGASSRNYLSMLNSDVEKWLNELNKPK